MIANDACPYNNAPQPTLFPNNCSSPDSLGASRTGNQDCEPRLLARPAEMRTMQRRCAHQSHHTMLLEAALALAAARRLLTARQVPASVAARAMTCAGTNAGARSPSDKDGAWEGFCATSCRSPLAPAPTPAPAALAAVTAARTLPRPMLAYAVAGSAEPSNDCFTCSRSRRRRPRSANSGWVGSCAWPGALLRRRRRTRHSRFSSCARPS